MTSELRPGDLVKVITRHMAESFHPHRPCLLVPGDFIQVAFTKEIEYDVSGRDVYYLHHEGRKEIEGKKYHFFAAVYAQLICGIGDTIDFHGMAGKVEKIDWVSMIGYYCPFVRGKSVHPMHVNLANRLEVNSAVQSAVCTCTSRQLFEGGCNCGYLTISKG